MLLQISFHLSDMLLAHTACYQNHVQGYLIPEVWPNIHSQVCASLQNDYSSHLSGLDATGFPPLVWS